MFAKGKKSKDKEEGQAKEAKLFQQIGRLQMEPPQAPCLPLKGSVRRIKLA